MKKLTLLLAFITTAVYADCQQFTVIQGDGRVVSCVRCCENGNPCSVICGN